jgi:small conductance mechanosensitive channel
MISPVPDWPQWAQNLLLSAVVVVTAVITWLILRWVIDRWAGSKAATLANGDELKNRAKAQRLQTIAGTLETLLGLLFAAGAIVYVMLVWGIPIAPLVAGASVVGIAIGFGAQDIVRDVISGFMVLVEDQYAIGDVVTIGGVTGTVQDIRLRTTVLRGLDASMHHVPNGEVRVATNLTPDYSKVVIDIGIAYDSDVDAAIAAIADEAARFRADPDWTDAHVQDPEMLGVNALGRSSVVIRTLFSTDPEQRWAVKREFLRRLKNRLDEEGIRVP